mmetsp:Transcript_71878/g.208178  ORF Transcript_71878/g.208178 Transcript_71878/m.208178 type:complete len:325 (+) Transcript_71878:691-1665(+)
MPHGLGRNTVKPESPRFAAPRVHPCSSATVTVEAPHVLAACSAFRTALAVRSRGDTSSRGAAKAFAACSIRSSAYAAASMPYSSYSTICPTPSAMPAAVDVKKYASSQRPPGFGARQAPAHNAPGTRTEPSDCASSSTTSEILSPIASKHTEDAPREVAVALGESSSRAQVLAKETSARGTPRLRKTVCGRRALSAFSPKRGAGGAPSSNSHMHSAAGASVATCRFSPVSQTTPPPCCKITNLYSMQPRTCRLGRSTVPDQYGYEPAAVFNSNPSRGCHDPNSLVSPTTKTRSPKLVSARMLNNTSTSALSTTLATATATEAIV